MRKLALNDEILLNIEKPARYIKYREACPLHRERGELGDEGQGSGGYPFRYVFSGCIRDRYVTSGYPDPLRHVQPQGRHMV